MIDLLQAIQSQFLNNADLVTLFNGPLYLSKAPTGQPMPLCVLDIVSAVPQYNTAGYWLTSVDLQFNCYANSDTALTGTALIKNVFDFCVLDMPTSKYGVVEMRRVNEGIVREDEVVFHSFVVYRVWLQETPVG